MIIGPGRLMSGSAGGVGDSGVPNLLALIQGINITEVPAPQTYAAFALRKGSQKSFVRAINILAA